MFEIQTKE